MEYIYQEVMIPRNKVQVPILAKNKITKLKDIPHNHMERLGEPLGKCVYNRYAHNIK